MVHDWGSRDAAFIAINKAVLDELPRIIHGEDRFVTVPMQGSGTFAVEAMLTTFVPPSGKVLLLVNGAYGHRAKRILDIAGRKNVVHETPEDTVPDLAASSACSSARRASRMSSSCIARRRAASATPSRRSPRSRRATASASSSTP